MLVKRFVKAAPVKFRTEPRKNLEETRVAVNADYGPSSGFLDPAEEAPIVEDEIVEKDVPTDSHDVTSDNNHGPSASQHIRTFSPDHV